MKGAVKTLREASVQACVNKLDSKSLPKMAVSIKTPFPARKTQDTHTHTHTRGCSTIYVYTHTHTHSHTLTHSHTHTHTHTHGDINVMEALSRSFTTSFYGSQSRKMSRVARCLWQKKMPILFWERKNLATLKMSRLGPYRLLCVCVFVWAMTWRWRRMRHKL